MYDRTYLSITFLLFTGTLTFVLHCQLTMLEKCKHLDTLLPPKITDLTEHMLKIYYTNICDGTKIKHQEEGCLVTNQFLAA